MPNQSPLNIAQAADLVDLSIQKVYSKTSEPEVMYPKYFNVRRTEDYYEKDSGLSGLGEADFVDENAAIVSDVPYQTYDKTYTQNMVGIIVPFTFKMLDFSISWAVMSLNKLCKLRETLKNFFETIRSQTQKWGGSTTIIRALLWGDGIVWTMWRHIEIGRNDLSRTFKI